ncbi:hypothetical protein [Picrophilus oshimae]|uniref:Hypothetical membrane protein n=1 Tax=Picrophilus torridus (strain ATCC 700027 / DSM 9790 / JCM 10055 / NBRC 100828 / KAW 2/3) TaxID=1122961 RepID=Q6L0T9_PICTO|nr:hypothetical protein [Picrophilus oshimae]AAT43413.1 hypothetical membrane protein [Picrophilus oshimae DSM 9789]
MIYIYIISAFIMIAALYVQTQQYIRAMIRGIVIEAMLLGILSIYIGIILKEPDFIILGILIVILRGFLISYMLERRIPGIKEIYREKHSGLASSLILSIVFSLVPAFFIYYYIFNILSNIIVFPLIILFLALFLFIFRKSTFAHVMAYIEEENAMILLAIFIIPVPFIIEASVLLDVFAFIIIAFIVIKEKTRHEPMEELRG